VPGDVVDVENDPTAMVGAAAYRAVGVAAPVPAKIGRFAVLRRIGSGGMGVVYAAYDEDLDRRIALKLLHGESHGETSGRARLQREAQALARLSHPNVVQVYEVGNIDDAVYLAMELVRGRTLRDWLRDRRPPIDERIEVMRQAGAGLAAAHAAGLVHRDFKPENVLVGDEHGPARVRVVDFGIARMHGLGEAAPELSLREGDGLTTLTAHGTIIGTPSYMAKELWQAAPADAKSDQFAFCVAMYELLYEARPYTGNDLKALQHAITHGEPYPPPVGSMVPPHVRRAVLRGLAGDPGARWPDMAALLVELDRDPRRPRRIALGIAAGAVAMSSIGYALGAQDDRDPCAQAGETNALAWDQPDRERLAEAVAGIDRPWAADTAARLTATLDGYASRMQTIAQQGCVATWVRREQTEALFDRQSLCLDAAARERGALATVLAQANAGVLERAVVASGELPALDRCEDPEALLARVEPPSDASTVAAVEAVRDRLAAARAQHRSGRSAATRPDVEAMLLEAEALGYAPLRADVLHLLAGVLQATGEHELAVERYEQAWIAALAAGHDELALDAATSLTYVVGDVLNHTDVGARWGRDAEAMLVRTGAGGRRAAWVSNNLGNVLFRAGDLEGARVRYAEAVAIAEALEPADPESLASFVNNLGNCEMAAGAYASARKSYERAIGLREQALGAEHPGLLSALNNLCSAIRVAGDHPAALAVVRRAVVIADAPGIDPLRRAITHMNLSSVLGDLGQYEEALVEGEAALALYRKHGNPDHPNVGIALANSGTDLMMLERVEAGCARIAEAVEILDAALGPDHPSVAPVHGGRAACLARLGRTDEATRAFEATLAGWNESNTTDPQLGGVLRGWGELRQQRGDLDGAIRAFERALVNHAAREAPLSERARSAFALATALRTAGREPARVRALASFARDTFAAAPGEHADDLRRVDAFIAAG
jgi:eukaryotic-like serine/threonine-protein kinase